MEGEDNGYHLPTRNIIIQPFQSMDEYKFAMVKEEIFVQSKRARVEHGDGNRSTTENSSLPPPKRTKGDNIKKSSPFTATSNNYNKSNGSNPNDNAKLHTVICNDNSSRLPTTIIHSITSTIANKGDVSTSIPVKNDENKTITNVDSDSTLVAKYDNANSKSSGKGQHAPLQKTTHILPIMKINVPKLSIPTLGKETCLETLKTQSAHISTPRFADYTTNKTKKNVSSNLLLLASSPTTETDSDTTCTKSTTTTTTTTTDSSSIENSKQYLNAKKEKIQTNLHRFNITKIPKTKNTTNGVPGERNVKLTERAVMQSIGAVTFPFCTNILQNICNSALDTDNGARVVPTTTHVTTTTGTTILQYPRVLNDEFTLHSESQAHVVRVVEQGSLLELRKYRQQKAKALLKETVDVKKKQSDDRKNILALRKNKIREEANRILRMRRCLREYAGRKKHERLKAETEAEAASKSTQVTSNPSTDKVQDGNLDHVAFGRVPIRQASSNLHDESTTNKRTSEVGKPRIENPDEHDSNSTTTSTITSSSHRNANNVTKVIPINIVDSHDNETKNNDCYLSILHGCLHAEDDSTEEEKKTQLSSSDC